MPHMHDDAADQIMHQLRARMLTTSVMIDGEQVPATPRRYFETAEGDVIDVQAVMCGAADGGELLHLGDTALTLTTARALADHLTAVLDALQGPTASLPA